MTGLKQTLMVVPGTATIETFFQQEGSVAEFIGLFDPDPLAPQPSSTFIPGFVPGTAAAASLKSSVKSGMKTKQHMSVNGHVKLDIRDKLAKLKKHHLRVCKVKVLDKKAHVFDCRPTCQGGGTVVPNCLKVQVIHTAGCSRSAVTEYTKLYKTFMSAGARLLADTEHAYAEFNSLPPKDKETFLFKGMTPAEKVRVAYSYKQKELPLLTAAMDKFHEDVSNAAAFALYVGSKTCIPQEQAGSDTSTDQVCPTEDEEGLLDMGKKLQQVSLRIGAVWPFLGGFRNCLDQYLTVPFPTLSSSLWSVPFRTEWLTRMTAKWAARATSRPSRS
jgi:hypothetical protein